MGFSFLVVVTNKAKQRGAEPKYAGLLFLRFPRNRFKYPLSLQTPWTGRYSEGG